MLLGADQLSDQINLPSDWTAQGRTVVSIQTALITNSFLTSWKDIMAVGDDEDQEEDQQTRCGMFTFIFGYAVMP